MVAVLDSFQLSAGHIGLRSLYGLPQWAAEAGQPASLHCIERLGCVLFVWATRVLAGLPNQNHCTALSSHIVNYTCWELQRCGTAGLSSKRNCTVLAGINWWVLQHALCTRGQQVGH